MIQFIYMHVYIYVCVCIYIYSCFSHYIWLLVSPMACALPGSSVHGISQARILEWIAMPSSRGSFWWMEWTHVFCLACGSFTPEPTGKPYLATWCKELTHWKRPWCWERLKVGGEGDDRGWDGWMASLTQWTWVWISSGSSWGTGKPGLLQSMGLQRVGHDWAT